MRCDIRNEPIGDVSRCFTLNTREVVTSPAYWEWYLGWLRERMDPDDFALMMADERLAIGDMCGQGAGWLVCPDCIGMFPGVERAEAQALTQQWESHNFSERWTPPGAGAIPLETARPAFQEALRRLGVAVPDTGTPAAVDRVSTPPRTSAVPRESRRPPAACGLIGFVILNIMVSLAVAFGVISYNDAQKDDELADAPTQIIFLTVTPIPGLNMQPGELQTTIDSLQLTGTALAALAQQERIVTATPVAQGDDVPTITAVATINPDYLPAVPTDLPPGEPSPTVQNDGCVRHVITSGDTVIGIAQSYGVNAGDILTVNGMTPADANNLQVGDVLIIPVAGCAALYTPTPSPVPTNTPFPLTQAVATQMPAAVNAQIVIANVEGVGNVNSEVVEIRNLGNVVNLQGWTLSNGRGDVFYFPEYRIHPDSRVLIFSRQGPNTPAALYWGREFPAWVNGDTVTLTDANGEVQSTFVIGVDQPLF